MSRDGVDDGDVVESIRSQVKTGIDPQRQGEKTCKSCKGNIENASSHTPRISVSQEEVKVTFESLCGWVVQGLNAKSLNVTIRWL